MMSRQKSFFCNFFFEKKSEKIQIMLFIDAIWGILLVFRFQLSLLPNSPLVVTKTLHYIKYVDFIEEKIRNVKKVPSILIIQRIKLSSTVLIFRNIVLTI